MKDIPKKASGLSSEGRENPPQTSLPLSCTTVMFWPQNCARGRNGDKNRRSSREAETKGRNDTRAEIFMGDFSYLCLWTRMSLFLLCVRFHCAVETQGGSSGFLWILLAKARHIFHCLAVCARGNLADSGLLTFRKLLVWPLWNTVVTEVQPGELQFSSISLVWMIFGALESVTRSSYFCQMQNIFHSWCVEHHIIVYCG